MADTKLSALPAITTVAASDLLYAVQSGTSVGITFANLFARPLAIGATTPAAGTFTAMTIAPGATKRALLGNGDWWTTAVPYIKPVSNSGIAFDIMPTGAAADCWIDICSTDVVADNVNYETLYLAKKANGNGIIEVHKAGSGTIHDLEIQTVGGLIRLGAVVLPKQAATASAPDYIKGGLYFDTTLNKLRVGGAAAWETVTSAA